MAKDDGKAAIAGVIAAAAADAAKNSEPEQLEFLPPTRSNLTSGEKTQIETAIRNDRAGRPPGARNIATRQMLDFVRKTYGDPLMRRFQYAEHTPETLSIVLGCSKYEAFQLLDKLWADLAGYFYGKQAQVDGSGNAVVPRLTMMLGGHYAAGSGAAVTGAKPWEYIDVANAETQQNQALPAPSNHVSPGDVSPADE